jgi:hypothetical protein
MRRFLRENSLSLVVLGFFLLTVAGQFVTGLDVANEDRRQHAQPGIDAAAYLTDGHFTEALFENWESEFLQMGAFVLLTVRLRQRGSSESKDLEGTEAVDREPDPKRKGAPWPVRRGGLVLSIYQHSLSLALIGLFVLSFTGHVIGGAAEYSLEQQAHGEKAVTALDYLFTSRLWFQSMQNWQSEFLSIGVLVVFAIFLREKGSSESKPVDAPHSETGSPS